MPQLARALKFAVFGLLAVCLAAGAARGEVVYVGSSAGASAGRADSLAGRIIDSVVIDNRNIYDLENPDFGRPLFRIANRLHSTTRSGIVRREILFEQGDTLNPEAIEETARNLRTRLPLNDAWIEVEALDADRVLVRVVTVDQWSLFGGIRSFSRDDGRINFSAGLEERNLLGRAQFLSFDYYGKEERPDYIVTEYREPRLFGRAMSLDLYYRSNPYDISRSLSFGRPFYNRSQSVSFELASATASARQVRFNVYGDSLSRWETRSDIALANFRYRWGPYHRKTTLIWDYAYVHQPVRDTVRIDPHWLGAFPQDSTYHQINVGAAFSLEYFAVEHRINGFSYNEDITLGLELEALYGRAFNPGFEDHLYDYVSLQASGAWKFGGTLLRASYWRGLWFREALDHRRLAQFSVLAFNNTLPWVTWGVRSYYAADRGDDANRLLLGGKSGLRGYPTETSAGDRLHTLNIEGRFFPGIELLSIKIGGAAFVDAGRTWQKGEAVRMNRYLISRGLGLRLSFENLTRAGLVRIDWAHTRDGRNELVVGTDQYF